MHFTALMRHVIFATLLTLGCLQSDALEHASLPPIPPAGPVADECVDECYIDPPWALWECHVRSACGWPCATCAGPHGKVTGCFVQAGDQVWSCCEVCE